MRKNIIAYQLFLLLIIPVGLKAQDVNLEASIVGQQMKGDISTIEGEDGGPIEVLDFTGYGIQSGINLGRFNMGLDFIFGSSRILSENDFDVKISCFDIGFEYSLLKKSFSPFFLAGIGSVNYTDSFVSVENLNESDFSYNFGGGLKWILFDKFYIKGAYRMTVSQIKYTTSPMNYKGFTVGLGYIIRPDIF